MKNLKTYLDSGILEQYVLGDLSKKEVLEVEKNIRKYPEIRLELVQIEHALLSYAKSNAIEPAKGLRNKVLSALDTKDTKTHTISMGRPAKSFPINKYAFAISLFYLFISIVLLINMNTQLKDSLKQMAVLKAVNQKYSNQAKYNDDELRGVRNALYFYQNLTAYKLIILKGSEKASAASMLVAFNPEEAEVMIDLSSLKMPFNNKEHQYQLWALVDGKPVDLGVFNSEGGSTGMKKMYSVANAQAFAVTLEPKGGSTSPTMDQLIASGSI